MIIPLESVNLHCSSAKNKVWVPLLLFLHKLVHFCDFNKSLQLFEDVFAQDLRSAELVFLPWIMHKTFHELTMHFFLVLYQFYLDTPHVGNSIFVEIWAHYLCSNTVPCALNSHVVLVYQEYESQFHVHEVCVVKWILFWLLPGQVEYNYFIELEIILFFIVIIWCQYCGCWHSWQ